MEQFDAIINKLIAGGLEFGKNLLAAIVVYFVGRYVVKLINRLVAKTMQKREVDPAVQSFVGSVLNIILMILLILSVIGALGVQMTSFAALLASAGMAVGMALSGNLQNFAGGLVILLLRPYKIGDFIEINDETGTVKAIQIFNTIILTPDNKTIFIPNNAISSGVLINYSHENLRRVDFTFRVDYGTDFKSVREVLDAMIQEDSRIEKTPEPFVGIAELAGSSVNIVMKVWVKSDLYWDIHYDYNERVYTKFNEVGINFPFPQLTVHQAKD